MNRMKGRRFIDELQNVMRGFALGITEFIRSSREVQEELGLEPIPEREMRTIVRVSTSFVLVSVYTVGIALLANWFSSAPAFAVAAVAASALLTLRLLRSIWTAW